MDLDAAIATRIGRAIVYDPRVIWATEGRIARAGGRAVMARSVAAGRLSFTGDLAAAVEGAEAVFIAFGTPNGRVVAVLGVTFKPNTDDMREAPSLTIVPALVGAGATVRVVDPQGLREGAALLPGVTWAEDPYTAATGADCLVILTEWNEFRALDLGRIATLMANPRMADLRNVYNRDTAQAAGFTGYEAVGR